MDMLGVLPCASTPLPLPRADALIAPRSPSATPRARVLPPSVTVAPTGASPSSLGPDILPPRGSSACSTRASRNVAAALAPPRCVSSLCRRSSATALSTPPAPPSSCDSSIHPAMVFLQRVPPGSGRSEGGPAVDRMGRPPRWVRVPTPQPDPAGPLSPPTTPHGTLPVPDGLHGNCSDWGEMVQARPCWRRFSVIGQTSVCKWSTQQRRMRPCGMRVHW